MSRVSGFLSLFVLIGIAAFWPAQAGATVSQTTGISLSPFERQIAIQPTEAGTTFDLTLTNHTASPQTLNLTARDFGSLNDTGGVLLEGSNNYTKRYGLVPWLTLGANSVVLQPSESQSVPVTIYNRNTLQPGGHYGAIVASVISPNDQNGNNVAINQQVLSLILVDKVGGEHYDLKLDSINQNGNWFQLPNDITLHFQNPGNVQVVPRGLVKLVSPGGTVVAQGIINTESAFILPQAFRRVYVPLTTIAKVTPLPGLYHLEVQYRYDGITNYATKSYIVSFVDLNLYLSLAVLVIAVAWFIKYRRQKLHAKAEHSVKTNK